MIEDVYYKKTFLHILLKNNVFFEANSFDFYNPVQALYTIPISATLPELQEFASKRGKCFNYWQGNSKKYSGILKKSNQDLENRSILLRNKQLNKPLNKSQKLNYIIYTIISIILIIVIGLVIYNC